MEVLTRDGVRLFAQVEDLPAQPARLRWWPQAWRRRRLTVIFCHGYGLSSAAWRYQREAMRHLPGVARLVYYDHRGHGRSQTGPLDRCTIDQLGVDLAEVIEAMTGPKDPVVLVGHSMGGMAIMALAGQRPQWFDPQPRRRPGGRQRQVAAVALLATSAGQLASVDPLGVPSLLGKVMRRTLPPVVALMGRAPALAQFGRRSSVGPGAWRTSRRLRNEWDLTLTRRTNFASPVSTQLVAWVCQMMNRTSVQVWCAFFPTFHVHDTTAQLEHLQGLPVLLLGAHNDVVTPMTHTLEMARALPHATLVQVAHAGHLVPAQCPEQVNQALTQLVVRVGSRSKNR